MPNKRTIEKINRFWDWFQVNKHHYEEFDEWDPTLEIISEKLREVDSELYVDMQVDLDDDNEREMVITADGNIEKFPIVREVVYEAPFIYGWKVTAFQQPKGEGYNLKFRDFELDSSEMFFYPHLMDDEFTIMVLDKNVKELDSDDSLYLGRSVVMDMIGEFDYATKVSLCYLDNINSVPDEAIFPLAELPNFIQNNFYNSN
jgi:hypothetical protein